MDHERLCIAHVREVTRQLERIDDLAPHRRILATLDAKAQHATECAFPKSLESQLVRRVRLKAYEGHPGDLFMLLEVSCESESVIRMALRAQRKRLQALQKEERPKGVEAGA